MKDKIKVLWISDAVAATGFARVAHSIINELPENYEIHHLGINYLETLIIISIKFIPLV